MIEDSDNLIKEIRKSRDVTIVALSGEVDMHHSPALHAALIDVAGRQPMRLVLNLSEVSHMDSSGLGTLVDIFRRVKQYGGKMVLCGLANQIRSLFEITKLDHFFSICETEKDAASDP